LPACLDARFCPCLRSRIQRFPSSCRPSVCDPRSCQEHAYGPARWDLSCLGTLAGSESVGFIIIPARGRRVALLTAHHCYIHSTILRPTIPKQLLLSGSRRSVVSSSQVCRRGSSKYFSSPVPRPHLQNKRGTFGPLGICSEGLHTSLGSVGRILLAQSCD